MRESKETGRTVTERENLEGGKIVKCSEGERGGRNERKNV